MVTTRAAAPITRNWCAKPIYGQRYNVRRLKRRGGACAVKDNCPTNIWFADDIFGLKPNWIERFANEVERG